MKGSIRLAGLLLAACVLAGSMQPADAQIWRRAQQRVKEKIEERAQERAEEAAEEAAERALNEAEEALPGEGEESGSNGTGNASRSSSGSSSSGSGGGSGGGALMQALAGGGGGGAGEPVDFRELKDLLPGSLPGLSRGEATGQKSSALGIKSSMAEASYTGGDGARSVRVTITDMGTLQGFAAMGYAWMGAEIDSESDRGYERTGRYRTYPAHEKFDHGDGSSSAAFTIIVAERFIVALNGNDVDMDVLRAGADQIDFGRLEALAATTEAASLADFRALKALLPDRAAGLARTNHSGQETSVLGVRTSTAEATYEEGDRRTRVTITDIGGMTGLAALGYAWFATQIDSESDTGFERTLTYRDHPAYQKYEHNGDYRHATFQVVVGQRFVVAAQGDNVDMADLEAVIADIDFAALAALASN